MIIEEEVEKEKEPEKKKEEEKEEVVEVTKEPVLKENNQVVCFTTSL